VHENNFIHLESHRCARRTFLLGNQAGFVLYLPVSQHVHDATLMSIKWFGASGIGRKYLEANLVWLIRDGQRTKLDRSNQTSFVQHLDYAVRTFCVEGCTVRQTFFVPKRLPMFIMSLEADTTAEFIIEPEFDMRYYQAFNRDFSNYTAKCIHADTTYLVVSNRTTSPWSQSAATEEPAPLDFAAIIQSVDSDLQVELLPEAHRLRHKIYLKDEHREKLIHSVYDEIHQQSPDEAPIWDVYSTMVYAPARLTGSAPLTLVYAFADHADEAGLYAREICTSLPPIHQQQADTMNRLQQGALETGHPEIDRAYKQVFTRFDQALVARDARLHNGPYETTHYNAIFAGNKYFFDAWKRDENISLVGLLLTNDYPTVRAILDETWQFQDQRTGRLPHIIRVGEPLVYYSSDGTLWALQRLYEYTRISGDQSLLEAKYTMVEHFFAASLNFVQRGLLPSGGIIDKEYLWETWEDTPYTPRDGYPVEIELLWLSALTNYLPIVRDRNPELAERLAETLQMGQETFKRFYLDGYLADSLSYEWEPRTLLTPNGYIAFGLDYPLPTDLQRQMVLLAREQLAGRCGIRSLAPRDWPEVLSPEFLADPHNVRGNDMASVGIYNYHRGIEWLWLNQFFVQGELQCGDTDIAYHTYVGCQVHAALHEAGVGGLSELHDLHGPLGADFQAWSMTGFIASLHAFAGIRINASKRVVQVRPSIPTDWPYISCRRQVAQTRFDVRSQCNPNGSQRIEVRAIDPPPPNYTLRLGVRILPDTCVHTITINGEPVPSEHWRAEPSCTADVAGNLWVECPFHSYTLAEFQTVE
jgi:glycogen debranching enzyme